MDMDRIAEIAISALLKVIMENGTREGIIVTAETDRVPMQLIVRQSSGPVSPAKQNLTDGELLT